MNMQNRKPPEQKKKRGNLLVLIVLPLLLFVAVMLFLRDCHKESPSGVSVPVSPDTAVPAVIETDTLPSSDDSLLLQADSTASLDTSEPVVNMRRPQPVVADTTSRTVRNDSVVAADTNTVEPDSAGAADRRALPVELDECSRDSSELWVYPDPSGGLHSTPVRVLFSANRKATINYRTRQDTVWRIYAGSEILIDATTTLDFDAIDSCGKVMERRSEYYEIIEQKAGAVCPKGMEQVTLGTMNFCVDRYEWPNRKGVKPSAFVSYYQASDSCFAAGKRLCTADEWGVACSGPYSWKYSYGQRYERYGCVTHDSLARESGSRPECRSFYGVYDMSGNLLEWTSTKSVEKGSFYYVTGGFWESGPKSGCFDKRYSYYPQNQHNPVGFRCCRDISVKAAGGAR